MKKIIKTTEKIGKVLLVLMFSFSQLSFPLEVLADELMDNQTESKVLSENSEEGNTEELVETEPKKEEELSETETTEPTETTDPAEQPQVPVEQPEESTTPEDDIPVEDPVTNKYKVKVNGEEVTEYTLKESDQKVVTIEQTYDGEEGTYTFDNQTTTIDFNKMLYGTYKYTYSVSNESGILESVTLTIHYNGDNSEILNNYTTLTYRNGTYFIKGNAIPRTVYEVLSTFNLEELRETYLANLYLLDAQGNLLEDNTPINNQNQLILSNGIVTEIYKIDIEGDFNNDGVLNSLDLQDLFSAYLNKEEIDSKNDLNQDGMINILDLTNPIYSFGAWDNPIEPKDLLTNSLINKTEVNKGEDLVVKYYINGFEFDRLQGIEGKINYNKELLELTDINIFNEESVYGSVDTEGKFVYLLNNYHSNDIFITLTFKTLKAGTANISIDDIIASTGKKANLDSDNISTTVTITEYGKGGDVENVIPVAPTPQPEVAKVVAPEPVVTTNIIAQRVALSSDCFIKSLTVKGYDIKFDQNTYEYSIKVKNSVKSLDLDIVLNDEKASYTVEGNKNFKDGENIVTIKVVAEDGSEKDYTIKVNREKAKKEVKEEKEEKSSSKTIIIILIILVIIGLIYVIFKDDEEDQKESKK